MQPCSTSITRRLSLFLGGSQLSRIATCQVGARQWPLLLESSSGGIGRSPLFRTGCDLLYSAPFGSIRGISTSAINRSGMKELEMMANRAPKDAHAQYEYLKSIVDRFPLAVIKRVESNNFAVSEDVMRMYTQANRLLSESSGHRAFTTPMRGPSSGSNPGEATSFLGRFESSFGSGTSSAASAASAEAAASPGSAAAPLHMVISPGGPKQMLWKAVSGVAWLFLILTGIEVLTEDKGGGRGGPGGLLGVATGRKDVSPVVDVPTRFKDVQGVDEAKVELQDVVAYLKDPAKFTRLGGRMTAGVLLMGPPGTGKTMLARAVAGEASVPFFYISASELEEMFVGVGARRVRDLFAAAKAAAPAIIFIDEIDAVGSRRSPRDQQYARMTLNQLLVELDGFANAEGTGVVVIAATNFPESLDKALIRPGRFDLHITVARPTVSGRLAILQEHCKKLHLAGEVDLPTIALSTPGFSGAELANMCNIAALKAAAQSKASVEMHDFEMAKDRILMGSPRMHHGMKPSDLRTTAYHEGGHALVALKTAGARPIHKATILPRGQALGMVVQLPEGEEVSRNVTQLKAEMDVAMAGRAAEVLILGQEYATTGASSDLRHATRIARAMVQQQGFSPKVGLIFLEDEDIKQLSPASREAVDVEVARLLEESYQRALRLLKQHESDLHLLAKELLQKETMTSQEMHALLNLPPRSTSVS
jgi:ATP-dependent metalloprotease